MAASAAIRAGDRVHCSYMHATANSLVPHGESAFINGVASVLIEGKPAATIASVCSCLNQFPIHIAPGSSTVLITGHPAARSSDALSHDSSVRNETLTFAGPGIPVIGAQASPPPPTLLASALTVLIG